MKEEEIDAIEKNASGEDADIVAMACDHVPKLCAEVRALNDRLNGAAVIDHDIRVLCHAGKDETAYECVLRMSDALEKLALRFKDDDVKAMLIINRGRGLL